MRKLHYASGHIIVSDPVCKALLRYARALAVSGGTDIVSVPSISDELKPGLAHILVGPTSALFSTPSADLGIRFDDDEAVRRMEEATERLQPRRPVWEKEMVDVGPLDDYGI